MALKANGWKWSEDGTHGTLGQFEAIIIERRHDWTVHVLMTACSPSTGNKWAVPIGEGLSSIDEAHAWAEQWANDLVSELVDLDELRRDGIEL